MTRFAAILSLMILPTVVAAAEPPRTALEYAPSAVDNPLKGLVPYQADVRKFFPHSLEFNYLPFGALVLDYDKYDWQPMEKLLDEIASRGHQAVIRIFLEYPGRKNIIPEFLVKDGLKVHKYLYTETQPEPPAPIETPDYSDKNLRKVLASFIRAFGKKYDGDPRLGYITAGLLGTWGEWHNYPRDELWAKKEVQAEVLDAYEAAFQKTPVLLRYPANEKSGHQTANAKRKFGYHDDSFAWGTLATGKKDDSWFYMAALQEAGPESLEKWKTQPIGGEIRPEAWGKVFDAEVKNKKIQNFEECVKQTHASWLMDSGMFQKLQSAERIRRAEEQVRKMGYDFHIPAVTIEQTAKKVRVIVELENRGVAPFYPDWPVEFGLVTDGKVFKSFPSAAKITRLLPGEPARKWDESFDLEGVPNGKYPLVVRVPNPLPKGHAVKFANKTQDQHAAGWLTLGELSVR
jgi:Domain of unknown function (DUF4832)